MLVNRLRGDPTDPPTWRASGLEATGTSLQMRVPLPVPTERPPAGPVTLPLRPFRPGADEAAWLAVNGRAFASHPEQGHWDIDDAQGP